MKKVVLTICGIFAVAALAHGEECVDEKIQVQALLQENAQLRILAAPQQFNQAGQERARLEKVKLGQAPTPAPEPTPEPKPEPPKPKEPKQ